MAVKRFFLLFWVLFAPMNALGDDVIVGQTEKAKYSYRLQLTELILKKTTPEFGIGKIVAYARKDPTQKRATMLLSDGKIDLMYLPPTDERLRRFSVIKIDIHNGMLGYRVFIIRKSDQERFAKVANIDDLRAFVGGFGLHWGDFSMFKLNRLPVVGVADAKMLLPMLNVGRFDYFHRGLHEAWAEVEASQQKLPTLMVEKTITLVYDYPVYFMFNKASKRLKKRFEKGFEVIKADGSFKRLFLSNFGKIFQKTNIKNRTMIHIRYPLPKGLPPVAPILWGGGLQNQTKRDGADQAPTTYWGGFPVEG